jgi:hypothetical protein
MVEGEHLTVEARKLLELSDYERYTSLEKDIWIGYPVAEKIINRMRELYYHERCNRMPNMVIIGPTNNGKSMIKEKFYRVYNRPIHKEMYNPDSTLYPERYYRKLIEQPLISIQMPANPNIKRFLMAIDDQVEQRCSQLTRSEAEKHLLEVMSKLQVRMIIIDEVHNILAGTNKQQMDFLNTIRYLGNELKVPIVCIGTRDAYLALRSDPQLENRFEPWILPLWKEGREFKTLLESFITVLPLKKYSNLTKPAIGDFILRKSDGVIGEIATILRNAARNAIQYAREQIDLEMLERLNYQSPSERRAVFERALS